VISLPQEPLKITMCRKHDALQARNVNRPSELDNRHYGMPHAIAILGTVLTSTLVALALKESMIAIIRRTRKEIGSNGWVNVCDLVEIS